MRHPLWPRLCVLSACLMWPLAFGQHYTFKYYGHEQGLEDLTVTCLLQDRRGFLWLGTMNGLYRYDGARFQATSELPSSRIASLAETGDGTLLVATREGLVLRDGSQFRRLGPPEMRNFPGPQSIAISRGGKIYVVSRSQLWVGGQGTGSAPIDFHKMVLPRAVADAGLFSVFAEGTQQLWFGCGNGLCQLTSAGVKT